MLRCDVLNMGHRNIVANYAHKMGHAWGFHHEHQNPVWWSNYWSGEARDSYFFGEGSFFCERLEDYAKVVADIDSMVMMTPEDKTGLKRDICRHRKIAGDWNFVGGLNWLPVTHGVQWQKKKEPDWNSLMIYPSSSGSIDGSTGKDAAIILKKPNGDVIKPALKPSSLDIEGLRKMYQAPRSTLGSFSSERAASFSTSSS
ncbi:hypothetical protein PG996_002094 [Apiospora saccharicola]|uniref:Peptidase M12A domain-containing protein n=1 Tax=Apiospora saccharicola TaxID=335842 RepID=A0ABR1WMR5_9PEZI